MIESEVLESGEVLESEIVTDPDKVEGEVREGPGIDGSDSAISPMSPLAIVVRPTSAPVYTLRDKRGRFVCGVVTKHNTLCMRPFLCPNGRCKYHGGKSLSGHLAPNFKTGRYSKDLPTRLASTYEASLRDPDLLSLRDDIALVDARLSELLTLIKGSTYKDALLETISTLTDSALLPEDRIEKALVLLQEQRSTTPLWNDIQSTIESRRKLVESERRRLIETHQVITVERVVLIITAVSEVIKQYVSDRQILDRVSRDLGRLLGSSGPPPQAPAASE